jgi:MFS family permease
MVGLAIMLPIGILSDRFGRKRMLLVPEIMMISADLVRISATAPWQLIAASFLGGGGIGETIALISAIAGDLANPREQVSFISTGYFCSALGMIVGPSIASVLLLFTGIRTLLYISFFARIGLVFYILLFVKEPKRRISKEISYRVSISSLFKKRDMIGGISMMIFLFAAASINTTFVPVFARRGLLLSDSQVASISTFRSLAILLFRLFSNEIFGRIRYKKLIMSMLAASSLALFAFPYSPDYLTLLALSFTFGLCFGGLNLMGAVVTSTVADENNRGAAQAVNALSSASGQLAPVIMAPIAETQGISSVFSIGALLPIFGILFVARLMTKSLGNSDRQRIGK